MRFAVVCGGILAIVTGLGVGYAALGGSGTTVVARVPGAAATTAPAEGLLDPDPAVPGADPIIGAATDPAPATTPASVRTATPVTKPPVAGPPPPGSPPAEGRPPGPTTRPAEPVATAEPTGAPPTAITEPAVPALPVPAVATLTYEAQQGEDGWSGYRAAVRVSNPGERVNDGWRVTLTVPGGNTVTASGATASQDDETVTFAGGPIAPGESVSFTFTVEGTLAELPSGCRIDGRACS